ncbi:MAG: cupin domain-containing protein [Acidimicrobiales bacterium]
MSEQRTVGPITNGDLASRVIEPSDFVADTAAFVDVRIERSQGKASYSFIGPGVSQNANQTVNLTEPHGFNVGGASMPHGVVNNPHLHFTAEVFICTRGEFRMTVGEYSEQTIDIGAGTVFSAPTWVFRGFENIGPDDGWMFVVLGGDDTGGIIWAPHVLEAAAKTGLYIDDQYTVLDAHAGDDVSNAIEPFDAPSLETVDSYSDAELGDRVVVPDQLGWSDRALLSGVLDDHRSRVAPVIGHGMSQDRSQRAPISDSHGFSLEWLEVPAGSSTGTHRIADTQTLFLIEGAWQVDIGLESVTPAQGSMVSVPRSEWRNLHNVGETDAMAIVVCGTDNPSLVEWSPAITQKAAATGWALDASGRIAPANLVGGGR